MATNELSKLTHQIHKLTVEVRELHELMVQQFDELRDQLTHRRTAAISGTQETHKDLETQLMVYLEGYWRLSQSPVPLAELSAKFNRSARRHGGFNTLIQNMQSTGLITVIMQDTPTESGRRVKYKKRLVFSKAIIDDPVNAPFKLKFRVLETEEIERNLVQATERANVEIPVNQVIEFQPLDELGQLRKRYELLSDPGFQSKVPQDQLAEFFVSVRKIRERIEGLESSEFKTPVPQPEVPQSSGFAGPLKRIPIHNEVPAGAIEAMEREIREQGERIRKQDEDAATPRPIDLGRKVNI